MSPLAGKNQVPSYLSCFAASALYEGEPGKLYPKVVGVVELRSIRHCYEKVLQRKPVKPLRALCPDQVGDEGIDVARLAKPLPAISSKPSRQSDQISNLMSRAKNLGRKTVHHRRTAETFIFDLIGWRRRHGHPISE